MTVSVGDRIPEVTVQRMGVKGPEDVSTATLFGKRKVVVFALPGAFTPTCSNAHLPGFVAMADKIKEKGVDAILCLSVNDVFVMDAWGKQQNATEIEMIADGSAALALALGVELDLTDRGFGMRSDRFAMIVNDGVVEHFAREQPGKFEVSSAESILEKL